MNTQPRPPITTEAYEAFVQDFWIGAREKALHEKALEAERDGNSALAMEINRNHSLSSLFIMATGLPGEAGEVCEKLKKYIRDGHLDLTGLRAELGDTLYYLTRIASEFGLTLQEIMASNVAKLEDRRARGVARGSGDAR